jgi:hypothetical protein
LTVDTIGGGVGEILRIQRNNGNVGIGTTSPTHKLNVDGEVGIGATASTSTNYMLDIASTKGASTDAALRVRYPAGGALTNTEMSSLAYKNSGWRAIYAKQGSATSAIYADGTSHFTGSMEVTGNVDISGTLTATAKSFDIEHPTKEGMRLRYGSLEGPENGVYVRGIITSSVIDLPDHWTGLVHEDSITVNLTPVGGPQQVWVEDIRDNKVILGGEVNKCYYMVLGERKDIDKLVVEY